MAATTLSPRLLANAATSLSQADSSRSRAALQGDACAKLTSSFRGLRQRRSQVPALRVAQGNARWTAWFKFGKNGLDAEGAGIYGSQGRDDFDRDDVEQYFNYMGMLATEGSYDKMEALLDKGIHPVDILLLLAASEGDRPKIEELLRAGALATVTDTEGKSATDRASDESIRELIAAGAKAAV